MGSAAASAIAPCQVIEQSAAAAQRNAAYNMATTCVYMGLLIGHMCCNVLLTCSHLY